MPDFVRSGGVTMGNAVIEVKADSDGNPTECCNPVTGVCLGGGSDFSTAKVTINSATDIEPNPVPIPIVDVIDEDTYLSSWVTLFSGTEVFTVVLMDGYVEIWLPNETIINNNSTALNISVSGNIEYLGDTVTGREYGISGDCTINISISE